MATVDDFKNATILSFEEYIEMKKDHEFVWEFLKIPEWNDKLYTPMTDEEYELGGGFCWIMVRSQKNKKLYRWMTTGNRVPYVSYGKHKSNVWLIY